MAMNLIALYGMLNKEEREDKREKGFGYHGEYMGKSCCTL